MDDPSSHACTKNTRESWFVVNGVPIRYSLREYALMLGLYCHKYPDNYEALGSLDFVGSILNRKQE